MCTPLPACSGSSSGTKLARVPVAPRDLAHDLAAARPRGRRRDAVAPARRGSRTGASAYSAKKRSGSTPASTSAAITCVGERLGQALRRRARTAARAAPPPSPQQLELVLEARLARARRARSSSAASASRRKLRGQHCPRRARRSRRCRTAPARARSAPARPRRARACRGSGSRRRSPVEPNGLGSASGPSGVSAWLAGTQPTPAASVLLELGRRAPRGRARSRRGRSTTSATQLGRAHAAARAATVPLSHRRLAQAERARRPRAAPGVRGGDDRRSPRRPACRAARSPRRGARCGCRCTPLLAERGVGVGDARRGCRRVRGARPTTQAKCPTSQSGGGPVERAVEQVVEQLRRASRARPTGGGWRGSRAASPDARSSAASVEQPVERVRPSTGRRRGSPSSAPPRELADRLDHARGGRAGHAPGPRSAGSPGGSRAGRFRRRGSVARIARRARRRCRRRARRRPGRAARPRASLEPAALSASAPQKAPHRSSRWGSSRAWSVEQLAGAGEQRIELLEAARHPRPWSVALALRSLRGA